MMKPLLAAICLLLIPAAPANLAGIWDVTMPAGRIQRPDGGTSDWKEIRGTLTIVQDGARLTVNWKAIDEWTLTGGVDDSGSFRVESTFREIPMTAAGKKSTTSARWTFAGALKSGRMSGTAALEIRGRDPVPHAWTAKRR